MEHTLSGRSVRHPHSAPAYPGWLPHAPDEPTESRPTRSSIRDRRVCLDPPGLWSVAVVIPAKDEGETIEACIASVIRAADRCELLSGAWIVVVADDCSDDTADLAHAALEGRGEVIECNVRSPGVARRLGADAALRRLADVDPGRLWIANTDGDTRVPLDWLKRHLEWAMAGFAAVAGIVRVGSVSGCDSGTTRRLLDHYDIYSDGTHPHVHGANFGVRADAYNSVGGWSSLKVAEDHCLWGRLSRAGWRVTAQSNSFVLTSGRLIGRAVGGFADTLRARLLSMSDSTAEIAGQLLHS